MDDERLAAQFGDIDGAAAGEAVPRRRDEDHLVQMNLDRLQLAERRLVLHEADVHLAVHHLARDLFRAAAVHGDLDVGEALEVLPHRAGQQVERGGLVGGYRQRSGAEVLQLRHPVRRFVAQTKHLARVVDEHAARLGQRDVGHVAREERHAEGIFELLDALADGRLRAKHALGSAGEAPFFDDSEKMLELEQVHTPSPVSLELPR